MNTYSIKDENFVVIQGWMVTELKLKDDELMIFAIIHGFSGGTQYYPENLDYFAGWIKGTKQRATKVLRSLEEKNLIEKIEQHINGTMFYCYRTIRRSFRQDK